MKPQRFPMVHLLEIMLFSFCVGLLQRNEWGFRRFAKQGDKGDMDCEG